MRFFARRLRPPAAFVALVVTAVIVAACGKKGPPRAPLRPVPAAVEEFTAARSAERVTLTFTIPAANLDRSTPPAVDRVEVYALTQPASAAPPTAAQLVLPPNVVLATPVTREDAAARPTPASSVKPATPGGRIEHLETLTLPSPDGAMVRYYVAVPSAGRRRGPASSVLALPLSGDPEAPADLRLDYSERELMLIWQAADEKLRFMVGRRDGDAVASVTPELLTVSTYSTPVEFGVERCFVVRAALVAGPVTVFGPASAPACQTPVDRFAPAPPTDLQAVASEGAIELVWTASTATDLAGYVVLRAEGASGTLQPLTPAPIAATQYRDAAVRPGVTYSYAVVAVDTAMPANRSGPSNRQDATARQP